MTPPPLESGYEISGYRLVRFLGRGAMGEVWEAEYLETGELYALKFLLEEAMTGENALKRFQREAEIMAALDHPHIAKVLDWGEVDSRHWLCVELLGNQVYEEGAAPVTTLEDYISYRGGKLPQEEVQICMGQFLDALAYAHGKGLVHRDLKPANILLCEEGMKIADFGLVDAAGSEWMATQVQATVAATIARGGNATLLETVRDGSASSATSPQHALLGTFAYMSPEQKKGWEATAQSDLYAAGLVCFYMLTGESVVGMEMPSEIDGNLWAGWDNYIRTALKSNPQHRFQDAASMLDHLGGVDQPVQPKAPLHNKPFKSPAKKSAGKPSISPVKTASNGATEKIPAKAKNGRGILILCSVLLAIGVLGAGTWFWWVNYNSDRLERLADGNEDVALGSSETEHTPGSAAKPIDNSPDEPQTIDSPPPEQEPTPEPEPVPQIPPPTGSLFGFVYVETTDTGKKLVLPTTPVRAFPGSSLSLLQSAFSSAEADVLAKTPVGTSWEVFKEVYLSVLFTKLDETETRFQAPADISGRYELFTPPGDTFYLFAHRSRRISDEETQDFYWALPVDGTRGYPEGFDLTHLNLLNFNGNGGYQGLLDLPAMEKRYIQWQRDKSKAEFGEATPGKPWTAPSGSLPMRWCPPGTFTMGSPLYETGRDNDSDDETWHPVTLSEGFWIGEYEVTRAQFAKFVESTGYRTDAERGEGYRGVKVANVRQDKIVEDEDASWRTLFPGSDHNPVVGVSQKDAGMFCDWLTKKERQAYRLPEGYTYRLPTEAQWEYACRAGSKAAYSFGDDVAQLYRHGNFADSNSGLSYADPRYDDGFGDTSAPVGSFSPNTWGIFDMHGNVSEWCSGFYQSIPPGRSNNPLDPVSGNRPIHRGGSWINSPEYLRSAHRSLEKAVEARDDTIGFRVVLSKDMPGPEPPGPDPEDAMRGQIFVITNGEKAEPFEGAILRTYSISLAQSLGDYQSKVETFLFARPEMASKDWGFFREAFLDICFQYLEQQTASNHSTSGTGGQYILGKPQGDTFLLAAVHHREVGKSGLERCYWLETVKPANLPPAGLQLNNSNILNHGGTSTGPLDLAALQKKFEKWQPGAKAALENKIAAEEAAIKAAEEKRIAKLMEGKAPFTIPGIGIEMLLVRPGVFVMGSPEGEQDRGIDETQHRVRLTQPFWLGKYEVTQGQWKAVMGNNPSSFNGDDLPVENVSWEDAMAFCRKLNQMDGNRPSGYVYSLPTEAQWEYACRAGTTTATAFGNSLSSREANFDGDNPYGGAGIGPDLGKTARVGSYRPNAWGFYDMHGNVWEWCADWYDYSYPAGSVVDPAGPSSGSDRVIRGGSWVNDGWGCRSARRIRLIPGGRDIDLGFRPSLGVE